MDNSEFPTTEFSPFVIEQIGWYVYALQDPRDQKVFYVGKAKEIEYLRMQMQLLMRFPMS